MQIPKVSRGTTRLTDVLKTERNEQVRKQISKVRTELFQEAESPRLREEQAACWGAVVTYWLLNMSWLWAHNEESCVIQLPETPPLTPPTPSSAPPAAVSGTTPHALFNGTVSRSYTWRYTTNNNIITCNLNSNSENLEPIFNTNRDAMKGGKKTRLGQSETWIKMSKVIWEWGLIWKLWGVAEQEKATRGKQTDSQATSTQLCFYFKPTGPSQISTNTHLKRLFPHEISLQFFQNLLLMALS